MTTFSRIAAKPLVRMLNPFHKSVVTAQPKRVNLWHDTVRSTLLQAEANGFDKFPQETLHYVLKSIQAKRPMLTEDRPGQEYYARTVIKAGIEHLKKAAETAGKDIEQPSLLQFYLNLYWFIDELPDDAGFSDAMFRNALEAGIAFTSRFNSYRANHALSSLIRSLDRSIIADREKLKVCTDALFDIGEKASQAVPNRHESEEEETDRSHPKTIGEFVYQIRYSYHGIHDALPSSLESREEMADRYENYAVSSIHKMIAALIGRLPKAALANGKTIKRYGDILLAFRKKDFSGFRYDLFDIISKNIRHLPDCVILDQLTFKALLDAIASPVKSGETDYKDEDYYNIKNRKIELFFTTLPGLINELPKEIISDKLKLRRIISIWGRIVMALDLDKKTSHSDDAVNPIEHQRLTLLKMEHLRSGFAAYMGVAARSGTELESFYALFTDFQFLEHSVIPDTFIFIGVMKDVFGIGLAPDEISCYLPALRAKLIEKLKLIKVDSSNIHKFLMLPVSYINAVNAYEGMFDIVEPSMRRDPNIPVNEGTINDMRDTLISRRTMRWAAENSRINLERENYVPLRTYADVLAWPLSWMVMAGGNPVARIINHMASSYYYGQGPLWIPRNVGGVRTRMSQILEGKGLQVSWIRKQSDWTTTKKDIVRDSQGGLYMGYKDAGEILGKLQKPTPLPGELEYYLKKDAFISEYLRDAVREVGWEGIRKAVPSDTVNSVVYLLVEISKKYWKVSPEMIRKMGAVLFEVASTADATYPELKGSKGLFDFLFKTRFKELGGIERLENYIGMWMKLARVAKLLGIKIEYYQDPLRELVLKMLEKIKEDRAQGDGFALQNRCIDSMLGILEAAAVKGWDISHVLETGGFAEHGLIGLVKEFVESLRDEEIYGGRRDDFERGITVCHTLDKTARMVKNGWNIERIRPLIFIESQIMAGMRVRSADDLRKIDDLMYHFMRFLTAIERDVHHPLHPTYQADQLENTIRSIGSCYFVYPERFKAALDFLSGSRNSIATSLFLETFNKWSMKALPDLEQMRIIIGSIQSFADMRSPNNAEERIYVDEDMISRFITQLPEYVWHDNASLVAVLNTAYAFMRLPQLSRYSDYLRYFLHGLNERQLKRDMIGRLFDLSSEENIAKICQAMLDYHRIAGDLKGEIVFEDCDLTPAALEVRLAVEYKRALENVTIDQETLKILSSIPSPQLKEAGVVQKVIKYLEGIVPDFSGEKGVLMYADEAAFVAGAMVLAECWTRMRKDKYVPHILRVSKQHGSIGAYYRAERAAVLEMMANAGFDVDYILSGQDVLARELGKNSAPSEGGQKWEDLYMQLLRRILGTRKTQPELFFSFNRRPGKLVHQLNHIDNGSRQFNRAKNGEGKAAIEVIRALLPLVEKERESEKHRGRARILEDWHDRLNGLIGMIEQEKKDLLVKGLKAVRSSKRIPQIFFDNHRLGCCIFWPDGGEHQEIGRIVLDPQTPLLEIWPNGGGEFMGVATQYLGTNRAGEPVVFIDTMELSQSLYEMLGRSFTHRFALDATVLDAYRMGARELAVFKCAYGTSEEFVNMLKDLHPKIKGVIREDKKYQFTSVDVNDSALCIDEKTAAHHYTDAFGHGERLKGKADCYVIDVARYARAVLKVRSQEAPKKAADPALEAFRKQISGILGEDMQAEILPGTSGSRTLRIKDISGSIVGEITGHRWANGATFHVDGFFVRPSYRGQGLGGEMLDELLRIAKEEGYKKASLECFRKDPDGLDLVKFYSKSGFKPIGDITQSPVRMERPL